MHICIAACRANPQLSSSNRTLQSALKAYGARVSVLNWNEHTVAEFLSCDLILLRQTWDYQNDPGGFAAWLIRLHAMGAQIEARPDLAIWNNDKRTLIEIKDAGVEIPETYRSVEDAIARQGDRGSTEKLVLKPAFGGDGVGVDNHVSLRLKRHGQRLSKTCLDAQLWCRSSCRKLMTVSGK